MNADAIRAALGPTALPWLAGLLLVVLAAATLEGLVLSAARRGAYDWRAFAASLADTVGRRAIDALGLSIGPPGSGPKSAPRRAQEGGL